MTRSTFTSRAAIGLLGLALSTQALAHHSFAVFFSDDKPVTSVQGKVTGFDFKNPHGASLFDAPLPLVVYCRKCL